MNKKDSKKMREVMRYIKTDIPVRDPYVLVDGGKYYLYGTRVETCWGYADGFDVYVSEDLEHWSDAIEVFHNNGDFWADQNYWAPEVHSYMGAYYMFASFKKENVARGTQILCSESPLGPFLPISEGPITPREWECLDGTLYVDRNQQPYIVFCHEWQQIGNGTMCAMKLSKDLTTAISEPWVLFDAKSTGWTKSIDGDNSYVTDGPFLQRMEDGSLVMLWSSHGEEGYAQALARSTNGEIDGLWQQDKELIFSKNGGHGMVFKSLQGEPMLTIHMPNKTPDERAAFFPIVEENGTYKLI